MVVSIMNEDHLPQVITIIMHLLFVTEAFPMGNSDPSDASTSSMASTKRPNMFGVLAGAPPLHLAKALVL